MVLRAAQLPTIFEGEIMWQIEWEDSKGEGGAGTINETHTGTKSVVTHANENEFLFIRLKKRSCLSKYVKNNNQEIAKDHVQPSLFLNNLFTDALNEVLEDEETNKLFGQLKEEPTGTFAMLDEEDPPTWNDIANTLEEMKEYEEDKSGIVLDKTMGWIEQYRYKPYEEEIQTCTGFDESKLFKKRVILDPRYQELIEYMLEDTMFNLMEEATYEEFDLAQKQRTYIRKEALEGQINNPPQ
jgi:hypothetical protein